MFMDYELRDDSRISATSTVDIAEENAIAPLVARSPRQGLGVQRVGIRGVPANESFSDLVNARDRLLAKHKDREDGIRVIQMLIAWATQWPQGIWEISGAHLDVIADRGDHFGIDANAEPAPRFAPDSISTTNARAATVAEFRQADESESHPSAEKPLTGDALLKPDYTIVRTGGGGSSGPRKDRQMSAADRNRRRDAERAEDGLRPMMASGRVSIEAHEGLYNTRDATGQKVAPGNLFEVVGLAIARGMTYDDVVAALAARAAK